MTFEEILEITKNRIDETYEDEQVDVIIRSAINHAYIFDLSKLDPVFKTTVLVISDGMAKLPNNLRYIESFPRDLVKGEYRKGKYFFSPKEGEQITIKYAAIPDKLVEDDDEPTISEDLQYLLTTKACEVYFKHRKKNSLANLYREEYEYEKEKFRMVQDGIEEVVKDIYEDVGGEF